MPHAITESEIEQVSLDILAEMGYGVVNGIDIACDGVKPERKSYSDVVLIDRLKEAVEKINPKIQGEAREAALKKVLRSESQSLVVDNQSFHKMLVEGVDVEYRKAGRIAGDKVLLIDFDEILFRAIALNRINLKSTAQCGNNIIRRFFPIII